MKNNDQINHYSFRSEKSRIAVRIRPFLTVIKIVTFLMAISGFVLLIGDITFGWALVGFSALPAMAVEWYDGELHHLKTKREALQIDDVLSADILGRLSKDISPKKLAEVIGQTSGGQFFAMRFGIGNGFLKEISSDNPDDISVVWQHAWETYKSCNTHNISAAVIVVSLIKASADGQKLLNHLQLRVDDLIDGVNWNDHLHDVAKSADSLKLTGGVARDWDFGWTPLLDKYAQNMTSQVKYLDVVLNKLASHEEIIEQMMDVFSKNGRQNITLVGPDGAGKTSIVYAFASRLLDGEICREKRLKYNKVYMMDASALIASAPGRGEIEKLLNKIINEAYRAKNIMLFFDNAQSFFANEVGAVDISNVLLPIIESDKIRIILAIDDQDFMNIARSNPRFVGSINRINVSPTDKDQTMIAMRDRALTLEYQNGVVFMYQALVKAYELSERYVHDMAMPKKAISLLESAIGYSEDGLVTALSVQSAIEKTVGVKLGPVSDDAEKKVLLDMETLIHQRMVNQSRAVKAVSDALRRARTGVRNNNRPVGTFLFLGPTGVGKTELAKSLAAVYFGGEDNIIRVDMNEYTTKYDVKRLTETVSENDTSLVSRISKQPFSVVLLDEIEKASDEVISSLLQMLDEGVLRDSGNHEVSFRDSIIIATSNAGAERICEYIERGMDLAKYENHIVDELVKQKAFRPEMLNRFDEIVMFRPLSKTELVKVVDLIIDSINKTLESQQIKVNVADNAKKYLVEKGYDPKMGARPMRRIVQKTVENVIAEEMLKGNNMPGTTIDVPLSTIRKIIETEDQADKIVTG